MKDQSSPHPLKLLRSLRGGKPPLPRRTSFSLITLGKASRTNKEDLNCTITGIAMVDPTLRRLYLRRSASYVKIQSLLRCKRKLEMSVDLMTSLFSAECKIVPKCTTRSACLAPGTATPSFSKMKKSVARIITVPSAEQRTTPPLHIARPVPTRCAPIALDFNTVSDDHCAQNVINFL